MNRIEKLNEKVKEMNKIEKLLDIYTTRGSKIKERSFQKKDYYVTKNFTIGMPLTTVLFITTITILLSEIHKDNVTGLFLYFFIITLFVIVVACLIEGTINAKHSKVVAKYDKTKINYNKQIKKINKSINKDIEDNLDILFSELNSLRVNNKLESIDKILIEKIIEEKRLVKQNNIDYYKEIDALNENNVYGELENV